MPRSRTWCLLQIPHISLKMAMSPFASNFRNHVIFGIVIIVAGLIAWRLFILSYVRHTVYSKTAQAQNENIGNILIRGNIYIQDPKVVDSATNGQYLVATNKKFPVLYAIPTVISDAEATATALHQIVGGERGQILTTLNSKASGAKPVTRKLNNDQVGAINKLGIKGISIRYEMGRHYPADTLAANVLGFLGFSSQGREGQYGVEAYFDGELSGKVVYVAESAGSTNKSSSLTSLFGFFSKESEQTNLRPSDVVLTIDSNIQSYVEDKLSELLKKWSATGGTIIVQDPRSGKILAMTDRPNFNPNNYGEAKPETYLNRSTQEVFEPGSSYKPVTMAIGLDLGKITPNTTYTDTGLIEIDGRQIHNFDGKEHGTVTMTKVLEKSLNTGVAFVQKLVGQDEFLNYSINFGFGQKTGIDLPAEANGNIANLYSGRQVNFVTASFGQGIAVTPLQLINAYSALANGGKLMKPYLVDQIVYEGGKVKETEPEIVSIPISEKTSEKIRSMLVSVVDNGFDKARIRGYDVAGKTGTAQIPSPSGGYEKDVFIHNFLGFAPASNPKFVILIKMDRPQGITFAADSLSPTFRDITQFLINYYNIPPTR